MIRFANNPRISYHFRRNALTLFHLWNIHFIKAPPTCTKNELAATKYSNDLYWRNFSSVDISKIILSNVLTFSENAMRKITVILFIDQCNIKVTVEIISFCSTFEFELYSNRWMNQLIFYDPNVHGVDVKFASLIFPILRYAEGRQFDFVCFHPNFW